MTSAYTSCRYIQTLGVGEGRLCKGGDGGAAACVCLGVMLISSAANGVVAVQIYFKALFLACHAFCHAPGPIFSQISQSFDRFIHASKLMQHLEVCLPTTACFVQDCRTSYTAFKGRGDGGGRELLLKMAYTGWLRPKGVSFQASGL